MNSSDSRAILGWRKDSSSVRSDIVDAVPEGISPQKEIVLGVTTAVVKNIKLETAVVFYVTTASAKGWYMLIL